MRWIPRSRTSKSLALAAAALIVAGAVVGTAALDDPTAPEPPSAHRADGDARPEGIEDLEEFETGGAGERSLPGEEIVADDFAVGAGDPGGPVAGAGGSGGLDPVALGGTETPPLRSGSSIIKTGEVEIEVDEGGVAEGQQKALARISAAGGFVQSSDVSDGRAVLTFRVPAEKFESVLERLRDLGEVTGESVSGEDVSEEFVDLDARLRHWRSQEAVFLALMAEATKIQETIEIQRELSVIQEQIEQLEGRKRFLENRTEFSTLTVTIVDPVTAGASPAGDEGASTLSEAWDEAWAAGTEVVGGTLIVLGALVPLSVIVGLPLLVIVAVVRRRRNTSDTPAPTPAA